jgi:hypothetical protein
VRRTPFLAALSAVALALAGAVAIGPAAAAPVPPNVHKGLPPAGQPSSVAPDLAAVTYLYADKYQYGTSDGAFGSYTVERPSLAAADSHTLAELAVQSADGQQIVEVGWTVDRGLNGDLQPHLFVFHWVNRVASCYNGCGYVQAAGATIVPGQAFTPGEVRYLTIRHTGGNWWIGVDSQMIGYYPDSLWNGTYTKAGLVQWFGEVAAGSPAPCTDMGNGVLATPTAGAQIFDVGYWSGPAVSLSQTVTNASYYTVAATAANAFRYGGPGAC